VLQPVSKPFSIGCGGAKVEGFRHHHHQITKLSHSINAIGPAPHPKVEGFRLLTPADPAHHNTPAAAATA
jgi:hypothetical protein